MNRRHGQAACVAAALLTATPALAQDPAPAPTGVAGVGQVTGVAPGAPAAPAVTPADLAPAPADDTPADFAAELRRLGRSIETEKRLLGSIELGRGFRFNNPYRLATELGSDARSVSLTAPYADLGLGIAFGPPDGLQHGGALHASFAMSGVSQAVLTPSYLVAYRGPRAFLGYGRLGPSIILTPNATVGGEVAGGFAWFLTGQLAIAGELVFDVYYGAGTQQVAIATYPIVSGQLGLLFDQELWP